MGNIESLAKFNKSYNILLFNSTWDIKVNLRLFIMKLKTPTILYIIHRRLFAWTNGKWNDLLTFFIKLFNPKIQLKKINGILASEPFDKIMNQLKSKGYYICDTKLNENAINKIIKFSLENDGRYLVKAGDYGKYADEKTKYKQNDEVNSPRFQFDMQDIFKCPELVEIFFDKSLLNIAQDYLGSRPIADLTAFWWSKKVQGNDLQNSAAQKYHFDMDRIKFLKFFFYLTDVDLETGPHCYVEGSHAYLHPQFRGRGRFEEDEVAKAYGKEKIKKITGPKGSIIIADTRGLHKGDPLIRDERLLFQVQFSNSMFGAFYPKIQMNQANQRIRQEIEDYPLTYGPIFE